MDLKESASSVILALVRLAGAGFCFVSSVFILWALASEDGRWLHALIGLGGLAIGIAILVVEPPTAESLKRLRKFVEGK